MTVDIEAIRVASPMADDVTLLMLLLTKMVIFTMKNAVITQVDRHFYIVGWGMRRSSGPQKLPQIIAKFSFRPRLK